MMRIGHILKVLLVILLAVIIIYLITHTNWFLRLVYPINYEEIIINQSCEFQLDPYLIASIIYVESKFSPDARSHKGAMGLMQIMPETGYWIAEQLGYDNFSEEHLFEPEINIEFGSWYLANLNQEFNNNLLIVLAAYNAGRGNVKNWLKKEWNGQFDQINDLPFPETRNFINQILRSRDYYMKLYKLK